MFDQAIDQRQAHKCRTLAASAPAWSCAPAIFAPSTTALVKGLAASPTALAPSTMAVVTGLVASFT